MVHRLINYAPDLVGNIAVVITDGVSTVDPDLTLPYAAAARADGIKMIAVGVTDSVNLDELNGIASSSDLVFHVADFDALDSVIGEIVAAAEDSCRQARSTLPVTTTTTTQVTCMLYPIYLHSVLSILYYHKCIQ